jgi:hypothetical protein
VKKQLFKIIAFLAGLFFLLEFLLPARFPAWLGGIENPFTQQFTNVTNFLMVLAAMVVYLGPANLIRSETLHLVRLRKGWVESLVFLITLIIAILATAWKMDNPDTDFRVFMTAVFNTLFYGVGLAFYITSMGLVSFYLVSAAHRAFLLNSVESGLMMLSASIVLLGLTPAGDYLSQFMPVGLKLDGITQWILGTPNTAVQKAVLFGACGGAFTAAMRNWLSLGKSGE